MVPKESRGALHAGKRDRAGSDRRHSAHLRHDPETTAGLTALARVPLFLQTAMQRLGFDSAGIARRAGLTDFQIRRPDSRIPLRRVLDLWQILIDQAPGKPIGLMLGTAGKFEDVGLVGYVLRFSETPLAALTRLSRYMRIVTEAIRMEVATEASRVTVRYDSHPLLDAMRHPIDGRLAVTVHLVRELSGLPIAPLEVRFSYPRPADLSEYHHVFGAPLKFERSPSMLLFRKTDLEVPTLARDDTLEGYLETLAKMELDSLTGGESFLNRVRCAIWTELSGGTVRGRDIADRLGISISTLERRLRSQDTKFSTVLDRFRHELALDLLRSGKINTDDIAFLLGYSDRRSFQRAFVRWEGVSPATYCAKP